MSGMQEYSLWDFAIIDRNNLVRDYNYSKIYLRYAGMQYSPYRPRGQIERDVLNIRSGLRSHSGFMCSHSGCGCCVYVVVFCVY